VDSSIQLGTANRRFTYVDRPAKYGQAGSTLHNILIPYFVDRCTRRPGQPDPRMLKVTGTPWVFNSSPTPFRYWGLIPSIAAFSIMQRESTLLGHSGDEIRAANNRLYLQCESCSWSQHGLPMLFLIPFISVLSLTACVLTCGWYMYNLKA